MGTSVMAERVDVADTHMGRAMVSWSKDSVQSAKIAGGRLQVNTHAFDVCGFE